MEEAFNQEAGVVQHIGTYYGYQVPRAIAQYKKWSGADKVAAILGWGTADTEALTGFLAERQVTRQFWPEDVAVLDSFPKTPAGKVQKPLLRRMLEAEGGRPDGRIEE